jgi:hypothetical protein
MPPRPSLAQVVDLMLTPARRLANPALWVNVKRELSDQRTGRQNDKRAALLHILQRPGIPIIRDIDGNGHR